MLTPKRARRGFTLAEVVVAVGIVAVLAAVTVPTIRGRLQDSYENALISEFDNLSSAVVAYRQDVGKYPPTLDYLSQLPTTPTDRCSNNLTATQKANWRGPYVTRNIRATAYYVVAQKDSVQTTLVTNGSPIGIYIELFGPDLQTAQNIDLKVDGVINKTNGTVIWDANGGDYYIHYVIPTKSGAC